MSAAGHPGATATDLDGEVGVCVDPRRRFEVSCDFLVIGGGACGLVAALAARDGGAEVIVLEGDAAPGGSTALSSGFIPAAGTHFQKNAGFTDSAHQLEADILAKSAGLADPVLAHAVAGASAATIEWLTERHQLPFMLLTDLHYPGHSVPRMHCLPEKTGQALAQHLAQACERAGITVLPSARAVELITDGRGRVLGASCRRPDGQQEDVGCKALMLACGGFGGHPARVEQHLPEIAQALFFGHRGNRGDALTWGRALGGFAQELTGYQGHGSVAVPHGILITWALMMEGGIQINAAGERFANEHRGYSEHAVEVLRQPGGMAWVVYDQRIHTLGLTFPDYCDAASAGAVRQADSLAALAEVTGTPPEALAATLTEVTRLQGGQGLDRHGRAFTGQAALQAPWYAIRVTGALFHTQGGLAVDHCARVLRPDGTAFANLYAGGGAARGVSGPAASGYLSGNGLLSAVNLGRLAGEHAAARLSAA